MFMKRYLPSQQLKASMHYYRGVPANINKKFLSKKVDAAFISSINAKRCRSPHLGIVAKREVTSVLILPHKSPKKDKESATSNILADILGFSGEVVIGDKALKYYLENKEHIDLAQEWYERYKLPFVFATLCYHHKTPLIEKIEQRFGKTQYKIPQYILQKASKRTDIAPKAIIEYLKLISYTIQEKEKRSLKKFLTKAKKLSSIPK